MEIYEIITQSGRDHLKTDKKENDYLLKIFLYFLYTDRNVTQNDTQLFWIVHLMIYSASQN